MQQRPPRQCNDDEPVMFGKFCRQQFDALMDDLPVHLGGECLVFELLLDALRSQRGDSIGTHQAAGNDRTRQFVASQQTMMASAANQCPKAGPDRQHLRLPRVRRDRGIARAYGGL